VQKITSKYLLRTKKCSGISTVLCYVPVQTCETEERISWYFSHTSLDEIISIAYKGRTSHGTTCMHVDKLRAVNHTHNSQSVQTNTPFFLLFNEATIGHSVADVPSGPSLDSTPHPPPPLCEFKKKLLFTDARSAESI
jgi:hypothetical protein